MELLVVITMLAILAALLIPAVQKSVDTSRRMQCISNLRQMSGAVGLYANDNAFRIPADVSWNQAIAQYVGLNKSTPVATLETQGVFRCPAGWNAGAQTASDQRTYQYNSNSAPFLAIPASTSVPSHYYASPSISSFLHPSDTIIISCWWFYLWSLNWQAPPSTTHTIGRPIAYLDGHVVVEMEPPYYQYGSPPISALAAD